jgi:hypothetical protein
MVLLLGLCIPVLLALGITGGLACFGLTWGFDTPSVGVSIATGFVALVIICLATPFGVGLAFMCMSADEHSLLKTTLFIAAAAIGSILLYQEVLLFAVPAAVGTGLMFYWCQPLLASILLAILAPLAGLGIGVLLVGHAGDK